MSDDDQPIEIEGYLFDLEIDDDGNITLLTICGECDSRMPIPARWGRSEADFALTCGHGGVTLSGDGLAELQRAFDDLKASLDDIFK